MGPVFQMNKRFLSDIPDSSLVYRKCEFCGRLTIHDKVGGVLVCRYRGGHSILKQRLPVDSEPIGSSHVLVPCPFCSGKMVEGVGDACYSCRSKGYSFSTMMKKIGSYERLVSFHEGKVEYYKGLIKKLKKQNH